MLFFLSILDSSRSAEEAQQSIHRKWAESCMGSHLGEGYSNMFSIEPCINTIRPITGFPWQTIARWSDCWTEACCAEIPLGKQKKRNEALTSTAICDTGSIWFGK